MMASGVGLGYIASSQYQLKLMPRHKYSSASEDEPRQDELRQDELRQDKPKYAYKQEEELWKLL